MSHARLLGTSLVILVIASLACSTVTTKPTPVPTSAPTQTSAPTKEPTTSAPTKPAATNTRPAPTVRPTSAQPAGVLFTDDFASQQASEDKGWTFDSGDNVDYTWSANKQTISIKKKQWLGLNWPDGKYNDFGAETEAQPTGSGYAEYGLVVRVSGTQDNRSYYIFGVTTDGKYYLQKKVDGKWSDTDPVSATSSQYVKQGKAKNALAVLAQGSKLSLYINGFLVKTVTDDTISDGNVGIFAGTGDNDSAEVTFTKLTILTTDKARTDWGTSQVSSTPAAPTAQPGGPVGSGPGTITVRNTFGGACQVNLWGAQDLTIRAEGNSSASKSAKPGRYGVHAAVEIGEVDLSYQLNLAPGGYCVIYCNSSTKSVSAGCGQ